MTHDSSNLDGHLQIMLEGCVKLVTTWELLNYTEKQRLQYLLFPKGMLYDRKNDAVRTPEVNVVFTQIARLTGGLGQKKTGQTNYQIDLSGQVGETGRLSNSIQYRILEMNNLLIS